mgnify:CR=1 FL=1
MSKITGTHISTHGYYLKRDEMTDEQIRSIKDELTVEPKYCHLPHLVTHPLIKHLGIAPHPQPVIATIAHLLIGGSLRSLNPIVGSKANWHN